MCISGERRFSSRSRRRRAIISSNQAPERLASSAPKDQLLQACLRYDWDQVEHWCNNIFAFCSPEITRKQLLQQDSWGNTPLHAACHYNPPLSIIHALLSLAKATKCRHELLTMPNANGAVPLVVACTTGGASLPVLLLLIQDLESKSQLTDSKGNSAIGGLLDRYQMLRKVPKFASNMQPLKDIVTIHAVEQPIPRSSSRNSFFMDGMALGGFDQCWTKMQVLLQAAWLLEFDSLEDWNPLHGAALVAGQIPLQLSSLLIRCNQDKVSQPVHGLLPLHMAIADGAPIFCQQLIQACPFAASIPHPISKQLPLVQAMTSHPTLFSWNVTTAAEQEQQDYEDDEDDEEEVLEHGILQQLWKAFPDALEGPDDQTKFYPAQVAANQTLDTIFNMLRLNPSIVADN